MDNNKQSLRSDDLNQATQNQSAAQTPPPAQPAPAPGMPPVKEGNNMVVWLIGGLIAIVIVVGLIYWYLGSRSAKVTKPQATPAPVTKQETSLEQDLDAVGVGDLEAEFSQLDKDLESL